MRAMPFFFDSFGLAAAVLLFAAALWAWRLGATVRRGARIHLRFSILLFAALGTAGALGALAVPFQPVLPVVAMLAAGLGSAALALSVLAVFSRPVSPALSAILLVAALAAGLGAGLSSRPALAMGCQALVSAPVIVIGLARLGDALRAGALLLGGGFALLCAAMALMDGAVTITLLFLAASLLGLARALQLGVEQDRAHRSFGRIG
jgi:hypothetical protein